MGDLQGTSQGSRDPYLVVLDSAGADISTIQFGTSEYDNAFGVAVGETGQVFVGGETNGRFDQPGALDDADAFVLKVDFENSSGREKTKK